MPQADDASSAAAAAARTPTAAMHQVDSDAHSNDASRRSRHDTPYMPTWHAAHGTTTPTTTRSTTTATPTTMTNLLDEVTDMHERVSALQQAYKAYTQHADEQAHSRATQQHTHCHHLANVYAELAALLDADKTTTMTAHGRDTDADDTATPSSSSSLWPSSSSSQLLLHVVQWQRDAYAAVCRALQAHQAQVHDVLSNFRRALQQHTHDTREALATLTTTLRCDAHAAAAAARARSASEDSTELQTLTATMHELQTSVHALQLQVRQLQQEQQQQREQQRAAEAARAADLVTRTSLHEQLTALQRAQQAWCEEHVQTALQRTHDTWRDAQQQQQQQHDEVVVAQLQGVAEDAASRESARVLHACEALVDGKARTLREELEAVRSVAADAHAEAAAVHQSHLTTCHAHATRVDKLAQVVDALRATCARVDAQAQAQQQRTSDGDNGGAAALWSSSARALQQQQQQKCDALDAAFHELRDWLTDLEQRVASRGEMRERLSQLQEHVTALDRQLSVLQASVDVTAATSAMSTSATSTPRAPVATAVVVAASPTMTTTSSSHHRSSTPPGSDDATMHMDEMAAKDVASVPDSLLRSLARDVDEVMRALESEGGNVDHFRHEYEMLYRALKRSHESEKQLMRRCQELTQELLNNAAKMQAAVKLSQGDHSTIEALKQEIEKAWTTVDGANDKDLRARETIRTLKDEVKTLQAMLQETAALPVDHTATLDQMKLDNKRLQLEGEEMAAQLATYTRELGEMAAARAAADEAAQRSTDEAHRLADRLELVKQDYRRERNALERAEYQARDLTLVVRTRDVERAAAEARRRELADTVATLNAQLRDARAAATALQQKIETADKQLYHTQQSYNDSVDTTAELTERLQQLDANVAQCEHATAQVHSEAARVLRVKEADFKELAKLRQQMNVVRQEQEGLQRQRAAVQRHMAALQSEHDSLRDALSLVQLETTALAQQGEVEVRKRVALEQYIASEADSQREYDDALAREREVAARLQAHVHRLEQERDKCVAEVSQVHVQHASAHEELKLASAALAEAQRAIDERAAQLSRQQATYEHVRAERNQYSKRLVEVQDEMVELRQKFKMLDHQLLQAKDEVGLKARLLQSNTAAHKTAHERLAKARKHIAEHTAAFDAARAECATLSQQVKQLVKVVQRCDGELAAQQQRFLKLSGERDALGAQLIRRNDELALLYEKLRLQQEALDRGEAAYQRARDDVRLLRLKAAEVRRQAGLAAVRARDVAVLRERVRVLERSVAAEQAAAAALAEELANPHSGTRWRKLAGVDPTPQELEQHIAELQTRLIARSEQQLECEMELQEQERLINEMQALLARQPGPRVARQLTAYRQDLHKSNTRMKQTASELNMTQTRIAELKYEAERLRREVHDVKRRYYDIKVRNDALLHEPYTRHEEQQQQQSQPSPTSDTAAAHADGQA